MKGECREAMEHGGRRDGLQPHQLCQDWGPPQGTQSLMYQWFEFRLLIQNNGTGDCIKVEMKSFESLLSRYMYIVHIRCISDYTRGKI